MKTTIELPEELFAAAKSVAAKRRTTLKAMMEHALRREISGFDQQVEDGPVALNEHGFPVLKRRNTSRITSEQVYQLLDEEG